MAEGANAPVNPANEAAAPVAARVAAIRAARDRMAGDLNVLEQKVRSAVGVRDHVDTASTGGRRAATVASVALTARRLWALPFWRLMAIGAATAGLVAVGVWRSRQR